MTKKSWLCCGGCLVVGLAVGYFYAQASAGRVVANTFASLEMVDLGDSGNRAFQAYQHETIPVAIYSLSEYLDKLKAAEQAGETPFVSSQILSIDMMLTHARLAKLYEQTGQTNLSEQHFSEALGCAKADGKLTIKNRDALLDFVAKIDKGAK
jgi:hypothetical protein